jgi:site-specific recombinase XerD
LGEFARAYTGAYTKKTKATCRFDFGSPNQGEFRGKSHQAYMEKRSRLVHRILRRQQAASDPRLFPNSVNARYDPDNFSSDLRELNTDKGLHWTCLHYRHTFGSQLAMKGESLYKISKLLGNSPEICRRHYAALIPEEMGDAVEFRSLKPAAAGQTKAELA